MMRRDLGPLDLNLALDGYLSRPDGRVRHVMGLERIAADASRLGVSIVWADLPGDVPGLCAWKSRRIVLAPWLFYAWPWIVRLVLSHELAHCVVGPSEEMVRAWQARLYSELLVPVS